MRNPINRPTTAQPGPQLPDPTDGFPRGTGDQNRPLATARWITSQQAHDVLGSWKPGRFLLGKDASGRYVGYSDDRHILTVAGSRAGKGVSLIIPNLLLWPGSAICIDPKGELATITACRRSDGSNSEYAVSMGGGRKVYVLDPFRRVTGPATQFLGSFNPIAELDPDSEDGLNLAGQIADALVVQQEGPGSHWTMSARAFLRGLILYIAKFEPPPERNLLAIRRLLFQDDLGAVLEQMQEYGGVMGRASHAFLVKPPEEQGSILSTCDVQTDFLEGEPMRRVLATSDFRMEDLKRQKVTVYLCLPPTRLATHERWFRLIVAMALETMERTGLVSAGTTPVVFVLDEFATLGHMSSIEKASGQIAGYGVKLWPIVQDLTQLERDYKQAWQTFMGNAGLLSFFGNTDLFTLEHISKRLGESEVMTETMNNSGGTQSGAAQPGINPFGVITGQPVTGVAKNTGVNDAWALNRSVQKTALMAPDEVARNFARDANNILAFISRHQMPPVVLKRPRYFDEDDDALFGGLFDPDMPDRKPRTLASARLKRAAFAEVLHP